MNKPLNYVIKGFSRRMKEALPAHKPDQLSGQVSILSFLVMISPLLKGLSLFFFGGRNIFIHAYG